MLQILVVYDVKWKPPVSKFIEEKKKQNKNISFHWFVLGSSSNLWSYLCPFLSLLHWPLFFRLTHHSCCHAVVSTQAKLPYFQMSKTFPPRGCTLILTTKNLKRYNEHENKLPALWVLLQLEMQWNLHVTVICSMSLEMFLAFIVVVSLTLICAIP